MIVYVIKIELLWLIRLSYGGIEVCLITFNSGDSSSNPAFKNSKRRWD